MTQRPRTAYCSFCRKSHRDVGPLVEGPGDVYICGECIELCQSIIHQEKRRRFGSIGPPQVGTETIRSRLDQLVHGQEEAREVLARAMGQSEGPVRVLLVGPSRGSRMFLARALAHALKVPFAAGDASGLVKTRCGAEGALPLLYDLLVAADFDIEAAQHGVVYLEGADRPEAQEASLRLWQGQVEGAVGSIAFDIRGVRFVCGGTFAGLDDAVARVGRHAEQPITDAVLVACGARPEWVRHLTAFARAAPLDEDTLARLATAADLGRLGGEPA
jgi:ATP-dependent Clp protease ATP-binding subunit ClpX